MRVESHAARSDAIAPVATTATRNESATPRGQRGERVGDHDARREEPGGVALRHEGSRQGAHDLGRRIGPRRAVGRDGHGDRQLGIRRQARQEAGIDADPTHERKAAATEPERIEAREGQKRCLGRARPDERRASRGRQQPRQVRLQLIILVAKVARAHDPPLVVLYLQHREASQSHRVAGIVEQVAPVAALKHRCPEAVIRGDRVLERGQPGRDARTLLVQVRLNHGDERCNPLLVGRGQAVGHHRPDAQPENDERHEHDRSKPHEQARAERHGEAVGEANRSVPSQSLHRRGRARRSTACERTSRSGTTFPAELHGGSSTAAARQAS